MKLCDIKINKEDQVIVNNIIVSLVTDIFILGHDNNYSELGMQLNLLDQKYGYNISKDIMNSEEILELLNYNIH